MNRNALNLLLILALGLSSSSCGIRFFRNATLKKSTVNTTSNSSNTAGSFAGIGWADLHMDGSFSLWWSPANYPVATYSSASGYSLFQSNSSGLENYSAPIATFSSSSLQTDAFSLMPGAGVDRYFVLRALFGSATDGNTNQLTLRFDPLSLGTLAGGRHLHNMPALGNGSARADYIDTDSSGNLFFVNGPSNVNTNVVGVLCMNTTGICSGRVPGNTYVISGAGGWGVEAAADFSNSTNFTYLSPRGLRIDNSGNLHVVDSQSKDFVTCMNPSGICANTSGASISWSPGGTAAQPGKVYDGGSPINPTYVASDNYGNLFYTSSNHLIYVLCTSQSGWCAKTTGSTVTPLSGSPATPGNLYTVAGGGGAATDGVAALSTKLLNPAGLVLDFSGNIIFSDQGNHTVRVVCLGGQGICSRVSGSSIAASGSSASAGSIYLVAGTETSPGFSGDGGVGSSALLNLPDGLRLDSAGNIVVADSGNAEVRVICNSTAGLCAHQSANVIATSGASGAVGSIYLLAGNHGVPCVVSSGNPSCGGDGSTPTAGGVQLTANDLALDPFNNIFVSARITTPSTGGAGGIRSGVTRIICMNAQGACSGTDGTHLTPNQNAAVTPGTLYWVMGDYSTAVASDGVDATRATMRAPASVSSDHFGNYVVANAGANKLEVVCTSSTGLCSHVSGTQIATAGGAGAANFIYTLAGTGWAIRSGDGTPATSAGLNSPSASAVDSFGNVVFTDSVSNTVRVVCMAAGGVCPKTDAGNTKIQAGGPNPIVAGNVYILAGTGVSGFSGNTAIATSAQLKQPGSVALDSFNNVVIADTLNHQIRIVCMNTSGSFCGTATPGFIYSLAGSGVSGSTGNAGAASAALLNTPYGVAVDTHDNIAVADTGNNRVQVICGITSTGICSGINSGAPGTANFIYTVAGLVGLPGFTGDGTIGTSAKVFLPNGVGFDSSGNLLVADTGNARVRIVCANTSGFCSSASGTLITNTGSAPTPYSIYTISGNGGQAFLGDGHACSDPSFAELVAPTHAFGDSSGHLIITDQGQNRIRFTY